jgi:hypothetical protein
MGVFGNLLGKKKKDKIELSGDDLTADEKAILMSWLRDRKQQGRQKLVEVEE